jgi:hypothetical protein
MGWRWDVIDDRVGAGVAQDQVLADEAIVEVLWQQRQLGEHVRRRAWPAAVIGIRPLILKLTVAPRLSSFIIVFASFPAIRPADALKNA